MPEVMKTFNFLQTSTHIKRSISLDQYLLKQYYQGDDENRLRGSEEMRFRYRSKEYLPNSLTKNNHKIIPDAENECYLGQCYRMKTNSSDKYEEYFNPTTKISPFIYKFITTGVNICNKTSPYLIILIPSIPENKNNRDAIRNSWGSVAAGTIWPNDKLDVKVKLAFLLGKSRSPIIDKSIKQEILDEGDIVQGNFIDSYYNLTLKILLGLKWVSQYCNEAEYVLKADADTFVYLPRLVDTLRQHSVGIEGRIFGNTVPGAKVKRSGKWQVKKSVYPFSHYPTYVYGNTYVLSANIVSRLFRNSEYMPYIPIEDAFITGILAKVIETEITHVVGFTFWLDKPPKTCDFVSDKKISGTKCSSQLMLYMWEQMRSGDLICKKKS
ncbi:hypothetical protein KUTeg_003508 [Tegillarca granosa]|uniref:Hexosyltransferase n=1 Tax=Tegillarca granosa TaxID=220873 RepID=A0ABQ9FR62_TEGGR|nr:hypothetical protein KUTeg_003508 [Tegillarca granosa]